MNKRNSLKRRQDSQNSNPLGVSTGSMSEEKRARLGLQAQCELQRMRHRSHTDKTRDKKLSRRLQTLERQGWREHDVIYGAREFRYALIDYRNNNKVILTKTFTKLQAYKHNIFLKGTGKAWALVN